VTSPRRDLRDLPHAARLGMRHDVDEGGIRMSSLTELIQGAVAGEPGAQEALFAAAYPELRRLARARLRDGGRGTMLATTALVHEAYLRFRDCAELRLRDRRAFFAYASCVMRSVIVDTVRERLAERRGGGERSVTLDSQAEPSPAADARVILDVHEALLALESAEPRLAKIVEMRYFGGYEEGEIAEALDLAERTVRRDWNKARMLLGALLA
jgi:RNA polymerase sigma factor (TIGR02999 family)